MRLFGENRLRRSCTEDTAADSGNRVEMLMWLTDPCRYDRWTRPIPTDENGKTGGPTRVSARVYVYFLGSVEAQQLVSIFFFFVNAQSPDRYNTI